MRHRCGRAETRPLRADRMNRCGESGDSDVPGVSRSRVAGVWSCYGLDLTVAELVFDRGQYAERRVAPPAVVEDPLRLEAPPLAQSKSRVARFRVLRASTVRRPFPRFSADRRLLALRYALRQYLPPFLDLLLRGSPAGAGHGAGRRETASVSPGWREPDRPLVRRRIPAPRPRTAAGSRGRGFRRRLGTADHHHQQLVRAN